MVRESIVCDIAYRDGVELPVPRDGGWQLDEGNNWWLCIGGGLLTLRYRYSDHDIEEVMDSVMKVIAWRLGES
jgi:hypothetical protein